MKNHLKHHPFTVAPPSATISFYTIHKAEFKGYVMQGLYLAP